MADEKSTQLILTDEQLLKLARNQKLVQRFPFLANASRSLPVVRKKVMKQTKQGCGGCGGKQRRNVLAEQTNNGLSEVRRRIMGLSDRDKIEFRKLLNTRQVVLSVPKPGGKTKKVKF